MIGFHRHGSLVPLARRTPTISRLPDGLFHLAASVVLLSSAWPLTKIAVGAGASPIWFAFGRAALSSLVCAGMVAAVGRGLVPDRKDLPVVVGIGVFQLALYFILAHEAVAWVQAGRTAILANTTTIWIVPLSLLVLREPIPARRWAAAALGLTGVAVLTGPWSIDWSQGHVVIGHAFLLSAALSWSIAIVIVRLTTRRPDGIGQRTSFIDLLPWCFLLAALLLLPAAFAIAPAPHFGTGPQAWLAVGFVGLVAGPLGTWCVLEATARLPAMVSSVGFLATPAVGLVLSNLILGEPFTPDLLAGAVLILAGVGIAALPVQPRSRELSAG